MRRRQHRRLVIQQLLDDEDPRPDDLAAALREPILPPWPLAGVRPTMKELEDPRNYARLLKRVGPKRLAEARERAWRRVADEQSKIDLDSVSATGASGDSVFTIGFRYDFS
jgi:hypothetical protein